MKQTKVLAIHSGKRNEAGACELYRVSMPLYYVNQQENWLADWISFTELHAKYKDYADIDVALGDKFFDDLISTYDLFVFARICIAPRSEAYESAKYLIEKMRGAGKRVIYEVDDDFTNEFRYVANGDSVTLASWCDAITVTTPYLARTLQRKAHRPTHIVPNVLDPQFWKLPSIVKLPEERIRIVLSGSKTHYNDWKVLAGVLHRIADDYENVRVLLGAFHPDYLQDVKNVEFVPALLYPQYTDLIKNADIVLAPVEPMDKFNLGKSPIKAVEGMGATRLVDGKVAGAAVIATDNEVYRLAITNGKDGLLVEHTPEAWGDAIRELITNVEKRKALQYAAYETAWKRYDLSKEWVKWAGTYQKVLKAPMNNGELKYDDKFAAPRKDADLPDGTPGHQPLNHPVLQTDLPVPVASAP